MSHQTDTRPGSTRDAVLPDNDALDEVNRLVAFANRDPQFVRQLARFRDTALVLSATDTGRELTILLKGGRVRILPYAEESFDVKIEAAEQVHWDVLLGRMDADAAFFAGKVRIVGSVLVAFRVKNGFLSLLQSHMACARE